MSCSREALHCILFFAVLVLAYGASGGPLQAFPLWGNLEPGPFAVGFRTVFTHDLSRPPLSSAGPGAESSPRGRPMQVSLWYPAAASDGSSFLKLEDYVFLSAQELRFDPLTEERRSESRKEFMKRPLASGASAEKLEALLKMATAAVRDAKPAAGRFPLVAFAHSQPVLESTMAEYLASHGFVVAAVPTKGTYEKGYRHEIPDIETLVTDLELVIATARALAFVDGEKAAVIGMSAGSVAALGLQIRNPDVRAVISLDGGIGEERGSYLVTKTPYYDLSRIRVPLLHLFSPDNPYLDFSRLRSWRYSQRHLVQLPHMRHGDFHAYGIFEHFVPGIIGKAPGDSKSGFEWVCRYSLHFLQAYLKGNADSLKFLGAAPAANGVPAGLLTVETLKSVRPALSTVEVQAVLDAEGTAKLAALYRERKAEDPQPISRTAFLDVGKDLLLGKRFDQAKELFVLFLDSFPDSAEAHNSMASAAQGLRDEALAKIHWEQVLRLADSDPYLDFWSRRKLQDVAKRNLGGSEK